MEYGISIWNFCILEGISHFTTGECSWYLPTNHGKKHWLQQNTLVTVLSVQSHWASLQTPGPEAGDSWMKRADFSLLQTEKASLLASLPSCRASPFAAQCPSPRRRRWLNSTEERCCAGPVPLHGEAEGSDGCGTPIWNKNSGWVISLEVWCRDLNKGSLSQQR